MFIVDADIIEGKSAAGFRLGVNLDYFLSSLDMPITSMSQRNRDELEISRNSSSYSLVNSKNGYVSVYSPEGIARFDFSKKKILYAIFLGEGYKGLWKNRIGLNTKLSELAKIISIYFDGGDDLYYPDDLKGEEISGIGFQAVETESPEQSDSLITCIGVLDWSLQ